MWNLGKKGYKNVSSEVLLDNWIVSITPGSLTFWLKKERLPSKTNINFGDSEYPYDTWYLHKSEEFPSSCENHISLSA